MMRAVSVQKSMQLLGASGVGVSHTGNTNKTTLATVAIPGGSMGTNGGLLIYSTWTMTNNANTKTARIELGATAFKAVSYSSMTTTHDVRRIRNRNSAASQVGSQAAASGTSVGQSTAALITGTENTASALNLVFSIQLGNGTDTATLESYEVWLLPPG